MADKSILGKVIAPLFWTQSPATAYHYRKHMSHVTPYIHIIGGAYFAYRTCEVLGHLYHHFSDEGLSLRVDMGESKRLVAWDIASLAASSYATLMALNFSLMPLRSEPQYWVVLSYLLAETATYYSNKYQKDNGLCSKRKLPKNETQVGIENSYNPYSEGRHRFEPAPETQKPTYGQRVKSLLVENVPNIPSIKMATTAVTKGLASIGR